MNATTPRTCMACKKKVVVRWRGNGGVLLAFERNGKKYYHATCPQCGNQWYVLKRDVEIIRTHTRDGRLAS